MTQQPTIKTERLLLRPITAADAERVTTLAGEYEVALNTSLIPHPYPPGAAEQWIATLPEGFSSGKNAVFAIADQTSEVLGVIGLSIDRAHDRAELGYWMGKPYWGQGFVTEAAAAALRYGFTEQNLHRIFAQHFARNPASGRVMQKIGMTWEGVLRQHALKWNERLDVVCYAALRDEWLARS